MSTKNPTFRTTSILTYKGPRGVRTPPGGALPPISGNSSFFLSFLYIKRTQKTHDCLLNSKLTQYDLPEKDRWRLSYLMDLLKQKYDLQACDEKTDVVTQLIESLCSG